MKIEFNDNIFTGSVMEKTKIIDNSVNTKDDSFIIGLNEVIKHTSSETERRCATKAKELYTSDKKALKNFIIDNLSTFTTGTFATVLGGLLLEIIKNILKIG